MSQDHQFYQRATRAAIVGLSVQIVLGVFCALIGLWAHSPAIHAATWHIFGGLPIWVILLAIYYQHRLERLETLETEQLTKTDAQAAALFDEQGQDLQVARNRLDTLYRLGLPIVSLVVAIYLVLVGAVMLYANHKAYASGDLIKEAIGGTALSAPGLFQLFWMTVALAFVSFIVARYESGMTMIAEWQLLRGGASYLMGTTLVAVLLVVGSFIAWVREVDQTPFAVLAMLIPAAMVLVGSEMLLTAVLSAYRPRRPGEIPRPAFDSRTLGLLTKPESIAKAIGDTINYQFGFEVSRSWFYQLLSRSIAPLLVFGAFVLLALSCIFTVEPHQQALVLRFGKIVGQPLDPGLHLKLPWPVSTVETFPVKRLFQVTVGSVRGDVDPNAAILWTNTHGTGKEEYLITAPSQTAQIETGFLNSFNPTKSNTPGMALIGATVTVQFRIKDLLAYSKAVAEPTRLLSALAEREVASFFVTQTVDQLVGPERIASSETLKDRLQKAADTALADSNGKPQSLGLEIVFVGFSAVHPPSDSEVAASFHEQIGALQEKQATIEKAHQDATEMLATVAGSREDAEAIDQAITSLDSVRAEIEGLRNSGDAAKIEAKAKEALAKELVIEDLLTRSNGKAAQLISGARAYRWQRSVTEQAKASRFLAELSAYGKAPELYRTRRYLETLAEGLDKSRKFVIGSQSTEAPVFRLDLTDNTSSMDAIFKNN